MIHRPHAGVSAARNAGLAAGTGQLVAFLDDDDLWDPRRLEAQVTALRVASEAVGAFCGGYYIDADGRTFGTGWDAEHVERERMIDGSVPAPRIVSLLVTRDTCLRVGGFDESLVLAEDNDFVLRVLQQGPLTAVPEKLVGYRRHGGNASDEALTESRRATDRLLAKQIDAARQRGDAATAALLRSHRQRHHRRAANKMPRCSGCPSAVATAGPLSMSCPGRSATPHGSRLRPWCAAPAEWPAAVPGVGDFWLCTC